MAWSAGGDSGSVGGVAVSAVQCARTIVATLLGRVDHVVLCPGSRSTPLALALEAAARQGLLELHVRVDERAAGFLALGLAKASGRVVPIVTTSGTAVGNLMPAVMEAAHAGVPIMIISADRPSSLVHTGANQTTDQAGLFGGFVRGSARVSDREGGVAEWSFQTRRLWALAAGERTHAPGPVQLNVSFTPPLVDAHVSDPFPDSLERAELHRAGPAEPASWSWARFGRSVVLAGDGTPATGRAAHEFATAAGLPLLAEPTSNARHDGALGAARLLLGGPLADEIDTVIVFGHPTLSRPQTRLLARPEVELIMVADRADWSAPRGDVIVVDALAAAEPADPEWLRRWQYADVRAAVAMAQLIAGQPLTGQALAAALIGALSEAADAPILVAGSSNPIRDLDLAPVPTTPLEAYANRGLAGIDGTIATAAGIALATDRPVTALMGDLTFLHDAGSLLIGPLERRPRLRVIVANDDGGSIFHTLEQGGPDHSTGFERVFATPTGVAVEPLAQAYGWAYTRVTTADELTAALSRPVTGTEIIEVPLTREGRRDLDAALRALG